MLKHRIMNANARSV